MSIIARSTLREFVESRTGHKDRSALKSALDAWFHEAQKSNWRTSAELRSAYATASIVSAQSYDLTKIDSVRVRKLREERGRTHQTLIQSMKAQENKTRETAAGDSAATVAALGILAYAASMITHEAVGHGGYCLAVGGHNTMLTGWAESCSYPNIQPPGIEAAGPAMQFGAGLLTWLVMHHASLRAIRVRYFLWLYMAFDLLISSGYVAYSGATDFGDAAVLISGLNPHVAWRAGILLLGSAIYYLSMRVAAAELRRISGSDRRPKQLFRLVFIPYAAAGIFACSSAALNKTMGQTIAIGLAAASSFGGGLGLLGLPEMQRGLAPQIPSPTLYITWSAVWGIAATVVVAIFLFFIGPGICWPR